VKALSDIGEADPDCVVFRHLRTGQLVEVPPGPAVTSLKKAGPYDQVFPLTTQRESHSDRYYRKHGKPASAAHAEQLGLSQEEV
jgi:hypothetical protein